MTKFAVHLEGVVVNTQVCRQRTEVRTERAVIPTRNSNVLAHEDARVALSHPGQRLDEGVVRILTAEIVETAVR